MTATAAPPLARRAPPAAGAPGTTCAMVLRRAAEHPDVVALRHKELGRWREYRWRDYADRVARCGLAFRELGVAAGDRVAILGENRPEWLFADLGAQGIGAIVVGLYSTSPAAEIEYLLAHSESVVAVVENQEQLDKVIAVRERLPLLRRIIVIERRGVLALGTDPMLMTFEELERLGERRAIGEYAGAVGELAASSVAILVYTSGTTGPPKGAMLTHANLIAAAQGFAAAFGSRVGDEMLSYLPLCHILERLLSTVVAVQMGTTVNFGGGGESLVQDLREVQPHAFIGVPRVWEKMMAGVEIRMADASWLKRRLYGFWMAQGRRIARRRRERRTSGIADRLMYAAGWVMLYRPLRDRLGLSRLRTAGSGAAPISPQVLEFFQALGLPILEGYGMTENTALATFTPRHDIRIGKVGRAHHGVEIRIADDGEILTRGACTFAGYWKNEAATRAAIDEEGWLHTGDIGELDADGYLTITDRKKDLIITAGGKNISPSWIENALKASPYVREAIVIGDRRRYITALIGIEYDTVANWATRQRLAFTTYRDLSEKPEVRALIDEWVQSVNAELAQVEAIKRFALLPKELDHEEGELTATQKVKRRAIAEQFGALIDQMYR